MAEFFSLSFYLPTKITDFLDNWDNIASSAFCLKSSKDWKIQEKWGDIYVCVCV